MMARMFSFMLKVFKSSMIPGVRCCENCCDVLRDFHLVGCCGILEV